MNLLWPKSQHCNPEETQCLWHDVAEDSGFNRAGMF